MTIGLMGALEQELRSITDSMVVSETRQHIKRTFYRGSIAGHEVVVVHSGVGKVRAATCCQFLIDHFGVDRVILIGVAGALKPGLSVGDIIVSDRTMEWDFRSVNEGMCWYQADPSLIALAVGAAERLGRRLLVGSVLTGDRPVYKLNHKHELFQTFNGDCVEMEGAAVGLVCSMNNIPFILVRVISDFADENTHQEFVRSFDKVAPLPAEVVLEMLKELR